MMNLPVAKYLWTSCFESELNLSMVRCQIYFWGKHLCPVGRPGDEVRSQVVSLGPWCAVPGVMILRDGGVSVGSGSKVGCGYQTASHFP